VIFDALLTPEPAQSIAGVVWVILSCSWVIFRFYLVIALTFDTLHKLSL